MHRYSNTEKEKKQSGKQKSQDLHKVKARTEKSDLQNNQTKKSDYNRKVRIKQKIHVKCFSLLKNAKIGKFERSGMDNFSCCTV